MNQAKHTPGPWAAAEHHPHSNRDHEGCGAVVFSKSHPFGDLLGLAYVQGSFEDAEVQANARLIAAAPDMLQALQTIKDRNGASGNSQHDKLIWTIADSAIRRALEAPCPK